MTTTSPENELRMPLVALAAMLVAVVGAAVLGHAAETLGVYTAKRLDGRMAEEAELGEDRIGSESLARELLLGRGDIAVVDLRDRHDFVHWHLPRAVNLSVEQLLGAEGETLFAKGARLVVLCNETGEQLVQVPWKPLRARGHANVKVLEGGLAGFRRSILTPPSLRLGAKPEPGEAALRFFKLCAAAFDPVTDTGDTPWVRDPETLTEPCLVSPRWVASRLGTSAIVDVREKEDFDLLHLPGAVHLDVGTLREQKGAGEPKLLRPDAELAALFGRLGIGDATPVVLVSQDFIDDETLALLAFLRLEHRAVAMLDGGMFRWLSSGLPTTSEVALPAPAQHGVGVPGDDFTIGVAEVAKALANQGLRVVDVRSQSEFDGTDARDAKRAGHVPGALRLDTVRQQVRSLGDRWSPSEVLAAMWQEVHVDGPAVVMCHSGHRASSTFFAVRFLLGKQEVKWFEGSWLAWAADPELPIEKGPQ